MSGFTKPLVVSPLADGRTWYLKEAFHYDVGEPDSGERITVPEGFLTDFASVPRLLWGLLPRWGRYGNAAVIHDYCYYDQTYSWHRANQIFLEGMKVLEVGWLTRHAMFAAVVLCGWWAWLRRRREKRTQTSQKMARRAPIKSADLPADLQRPLKEEPPVASE